MITIVWPAPSSSSSTSARSHPSASTRTRTPPCHHTWTRSFAHGWPETSGLARLAQRLRSPRDPGRTLLSHPRSFCMLHFGKRMARSNMTRLSSPHRPSSLAISNGTLVPEGEASEGTQGTGSWEKSAISARFFLKCQLRTCGRFARTIYQEIFPWQAYSNQKWLPRTVLLPLLPLTPRSLGLLISLWTGAWPTHPRSRCRLFQPPSTRSGFRASGETDRRHLQRGFLTVVQFPVRQLPYLGYRPPSRLRCRAPFVMLRPTSLRQSVLPGYGTANASTRPRAPWRVTSDILREVSEELIAVASNQFLLSSTGLGDCG